MSVYYYKGAKILAPFTITSNEPMYDVDTVSLRKQRASQNVQRWELEFNTIGEPDTQVDMFLASVANMSQVETMVMPQLPTVDAKFTASTNTPQVGVAAAQDADLIVVQPVGVTGLIPKGTFLKFSNHGKIYVSTSDCDLSSAVPQMTIYPRLRTAVTISHTLRLGDQAVISYLTSIDNQAGITFTDGVLSNAGTITLHEAI